MSDTPVATDPEKKTDPPEAGKKEEIPKLDPSMKIQLEDGSEVVLGDAVKSHLAAQQLPAPLPPEELEQFKLFQRAKGNDPEAIRELTKQLIPEPVAEVEVDPKSTEGQLAALQKELVDLRKTADQTGQISEAIVNAANLQQASQIIKTDEEKFPWLSKHPQGSQKLLARVRDLNTLAAQSQANPSDPSVAAKIREAALVSLNKEIEAEVSPFGGSLDSVPLKEGQNPPVQVIDDQVRKDKALIDESGNLGEDGRRFGGDGLEEDIPAIRSRMGLDTMGRLFERDTGTLMANPQDQGSNRPLEGKMLGGTPEGNRNLAEQGRMNVGQLRQQLRTRQEEIGP